MANSNNNNGEDRTVLQRLGGAFDKMGTSFFGGSSGGDNMPIGTLFSGLGAIISAVMTGYGVSEQAKESKKVRGLEMGMFGQEMDLSKQSLALQERQQKFKEEQEDKQWNWMEEDRGYNRSQKFIQDFRGIMDRSPMFKQNMVNLWRQK